MALITAAEARLYIPGLTGTGEDANLNTLITRAGSVIASLCGYPIAQDLSSEPSLESASYTFYSGGDAPIRVMEDPAIKYTRGFLSPARPTWLRLPVRPVTAIASIYDDPLQVYGSDTLVASTDYAFNEPDGTVRLLPNSVHGSWSTDAYAIKVTFTGGYPGGVPSAIEHAACLLVAHWWRLRNEHGHKNVSTNGASVSTNPETVPDVVRELVAPYALATSWVA